MDGPRSPSGNGIGGRRNRHRGGAAPRYTRRVTGVVRRTGVAVLAVMTLAAPCRAQEAGEDEEDGGHRPVVTATVEVTAEGPQATALDLRQPATPRTATGDGAEALRGLAGVDLGRMGGHGVDPRIRGLGETSVEVLLDGAPVHGGCPNRMDPPTSFAPSAAFDRLEVARGVAALADGAPPGGALRYERAAPAVDGWSAAAELASGSVHDGPAGAARLELGGGRVSGRLELSRHAQDSYEDGDGREVRSAFDSRAAAAVLAWRPGPRTLVQLGADLTRTDDALFAGAGMDAPEDDAAVFRARLERFASDEDGVSVSVRASFATVEHLMDNYSLRPLTAPMAMRAPSTADTGSLRLRAESPAAAWRLAYGIELDRVERSATRWAGPSPDQVTRLQSRLWPEVRTDRTGAWAEATRALGGGLRLRLGARVDRLAAEAATAAGTTLGGAGPSPLELWRRTYGAADDAWGDVVAGGLARLEWRRGAVDGSLGLSRTVRPPDATERYLAANATQPVMRWLGNPGLAVPVHHQLEAGWRRVQGPLTVAVNGYLDETADLVVRDRARGQPGVAAADGSSVYRNVEARRWGGEVAASLALAGGLQLSGSLGKVWAANRTDDRWLPQVPPLSGRLGVVLLRHRWSASAAVRFADRQDRVDDDPSTGSGLDAGPTPGWTVLDVAGGLDVAAGVRMEAGVDNLLDRTYATHLNRASLFDPVPVRVHEPGRTVWVRLGWRGGNPR